MSIHNTKKSEYIKTCSRAELAAMYLNNVITDDEYFNTIRQQRYHDQRTGGPTVPKKRKRSPKGGPSRPAA